MWPIIAGIGALIGGAGSAVIGLGSSILGGVGSLAAGAASGVGSLAAGGVSAVGSTLFGGGQAAVPVMAGGEMGSLAAAAAAPGGTGLFGGVAGISGQLADILPTVSGIMSLVRKPEEQVIIPASAGTLPTPRITLPTLPAVIAKQAQPGQQIFTTPAAMTTKPDYLPYIAIGGLALLMFVGKK